MCLSARGWLMARRLVSNNPLSFRGVATDLGFTRDRQFSVPKSAIADLGGRETGIHNPSPAEYGYRVRSLHLRPGMTELLRQLAPAPPWLRRGCARPSSAGRSSVAA